MKRDYKTLYNEIINIAEKYKETSWPIKESIYSAKDIENRFDSERIYKDKFSIILSILHTELKEEQFNNEVLSGYLDILSDYQKEKSRYFILKYRLTNIIPYSIREWDGGDWSENVEEFKKLYKKYNQ